MFDDEEESRVKGGKKQVLSVKPLEIRFNKYYSPRTERYRFQTQGCNLFSLPFWTLSLHEASTKSLRLSNKDNILL